jgi:hypothetical protein
MHEAPGKAPANPLFRFDPGWLFLAAGVALLAASVMIPALNELHEAQWRRDQAAALAAWRGERLENYEAFLSALERRDETLVRSLVLRNMGLLRPHERVLMLDAGPGAEEASPFLGLDPPFEPVPPPGEPDSRLQRLASSSATAPWLIAAGGMFVLIGLLPSPTRTDAPPRREARPQPV